MKRIILALIFILFLAAPSFAGMKVAFWGGPDERIDWIKDALNFEYGHVEIVFEDEAGNVIFFSAMPDEGARFHDGIPYPGKWFFFDLDVTPEQEQQIWAWAIDHAGQEYDWTAINSGLRYEDPNKLFCCEASLIPLGLYGVVNFATAPYLDVTASKTNVKEAYNYFVYALTHPVVPTEPEDPEEPEEPVIDPACVRFPWLWQCK